MDTIILDRDQVARDLRQSLAQGLLVALRDGLEEQIKTSRTCNRDGAANAVYQASVGYKALDPLFARAAAAYAAGKTLGEIGQAFVQYLRAASEHYVESTAEAIEDPDRGFFVVTFERPEVRV